MTTIFVAFALLGGLIATRRPENSVGWLMASAGLIAVFMFLPTAYGYFVTVDAPGRGPLGAEALWLGAWSWTPLLGAVLPLIAVRFPDGRVEQRWRQVDCVAAVGTVGLALSIALAPGSVEANYLPISGADRLSVLPHNPLNVSLGAGPLDLVRVAALVVIVVGYGLTIAAVIDRFRRADGEERLQLLWFGYAVGLVGFAAAYALAAWGFLGEPIGDALLPLDFVAFGVPIAVTVGILRYQLLDIELVVNRTLVYGSLTTLLAAGYAATITLLQRVVVGASGTTSNVIYGVAAFLVVVAFSPMRDWLQRQVDRRLGRRDPVAILGGLRSSVTAVLDALEPTRAAARLLDEAIVAFEARGGAVYLDDPEHAVVVRGEPLDGSVELEASIRFRGRALGRMELGSRRGRRAYSTADRRAIQETADAIGEAIDLARHLRPRAPNIKP